MITTEAILKLLEIEAKAKAKAPWKLRVETSKLPSGRDCHFYEVDHSPDGSFEPDETYSVHDSFGSDEDTTELIVQLRNLAKPLLEELLASREVIESVAEIKCWRMVYPINASCGSERCATCKAISHLAKYVRKEE